MRPSPSLRPEDLPLGSLESRATARAWLLQSRQHFQLIISCNDDIRMPLNLGTSTCERQIWPNGDLFEYVILDGRAEDLTEEQLQDFIDRHPIRRNTAAQ